MINPPTARPLFSMFFGVGLLALSAIPATHAQIASHELIAPKVELSGGDLHFTVQSSVTGRSYQLQWSDSMADGTWSDLESVYTGDGSELVITMAYPSAVSRRFYRIKLVDVSGSDGFVLIPAGAFQMGDPTGVGYSDELPVHSVYVSAFYMGKYEVSNELWDQVRAWGLNNGYTDLPAGNGSYASKGAIHPVHSVTWYDMVKWCNARSQKEGLTPCYTIGRATYKTGLSAPDCNWSAGGYRLPSEAEWEKAARGGLSGVTFSWGDTITHSQANYFSDSYYSYDVSPSAGYHPAYAVNDKPYSSPVGSFASNGYGLYGMSGSMWEWCWDSYSSSYYESSPESDPRGAASGSGRVFRGGSWHDVAFHCRAAFRGGSNATYSYYDVGFRVARSSIP